MEVNRLLWGYGLGARPTSSETALVDPGVHVCALILELLKLIGGVFELVL